MANSVIHAFSLYYKNLETLQDAIDLINQLSGGQTIPIHTMNDCTNSIIGQNFQSFGVACKVSTATDNFLDLLMIGPAESYWYVARINSSGTTTLKRRVTANNFA